MTTNAPVGTGTWQSDVFDGDPEPGLTATPLDALARRVPGFAKSVQDASDRALRRSEELDDLLGRLRERGAPMDCEEMAAIRELMTTDELEGFVGYVAGYQPATLRTYAEMITARRAGQ